MPIFLLVIGAVVLWLAFKLEEKNNSSATDTKGKFLGGFLMVLGLGMLFRKWFK
jgi:uncharacterized protein YjeT (DUF2065 family)